MDKLTKARKDPRYAPELRDQKAGRDNLNEAHIKVVGAEFSSVIAQHTKELVQLERRISRVGELLRISQPPGYTKYDIRWWRRGANGKRVPVLVRWHQAPQSKRFVVKPVLRYRGLVSLRTDGSFRLCAEETHKLVLSFQQLNAQYRKYLARFELMLGAQQQISQILASDLDASNVKLDVLQETIVRKLLDAGHRVDKKYRI